MSNIMRKKPKPKRSEAMVEAIVEACARVLEGHGWAGLTTNLVADVAGVSPGSVYQYFSNKEGIVSALIRREAEEFLELGREASSGKAGLAAMVSFIEAVTLHRLQRPRLTLQLILADPSLALSAENVEINRKGHELLLASYPAWILDLTCKQHRRRFKIQWVSSGGC